MLLTNPQTDPLVEILRLAYRRGLALRQEHEEKDKVVIVRPAESEGKPQTIQAEQPNQKRGN